MTIGHSRRVHHEAFDECHGKCTKLHMKRGLRDDVDGELPARSEPDRLAALTALAEVFAEAVGGPVLDGVEGGSSSCGLLRHLRPNFASDERSDGCITDRRLCRGCRR